MTTKRELEATLEEKQATFDEAMTVVKRREAEMADLRERMQEQGEDVQLLTEALDNLRTVMGPLGWSDARIFHDDGPSLEQVKERSAQIRNLMALSPWIKRGGSLRSQYVWQKGIHYANMPEQTKGAGARLKARSAFDNPENQKNIFGISARYQRERTLYADGNIWYLFNNVTKIGRQVPISEITQVIRDPDWYSEVIAFRRTWQRLPQKNGEEITTQVRWYYTDTYKGRRPKTIYNASTGESEQVDQENTIIYGRDNYQDGWTFGWPDAGSAIEWMSLYSAFMKAGAQMADALARFAVQMKQSSAKGAANAGVKLAAGGSENAHGQAVAVTGGELSVFSKAGSGYDFDSGRPLIAAVATALEVSAIHLTSDPGAAGSSYGSASTLDTPTKNAMGARQQWHVDFDQRILKFLGFDSVVPWFDSLDDETANYAALQALTLMYQQGVLTPQMYFELSMSALGRSRVTATSANGYIDPAVFEKKYGSTTPKDSSTTSTTPDTGSEPTGDNVSANRGVSNGIGNDTVNKNTNRRDTIS